MIRHIRGLTRPLRVAGLPAAALGVYAKPAYHGFVLQAAADTGYEGVACVDDAARASVLYCSLWRRYHEEWARSRANQLLYFICYMQDGIGRFANFIENWEGRKNLTCDSSLPGGVWWTARAMHALAEGFACFGNCDYRDRFLHGLTWLDRPTPILRARAIAILAAWRWWRVTGDRDVADRAVTWAEQLAASAIGGIFPDTPGQPGVELWGHIQEAVVARVGLSFDRSALVKAAAISARAVFATPVENGFRSAHTIPYEVSSAVFVLSTLAQATGDAAFAELAGKARLWFRGRNASNSPIYDQGLGVVYDGIDHGRRSANAGAESNIEGGFALLPELPLSLY